MYWSTMPASSKSGPAENMNRDDYADALAVHFWAPFNLMAEVLPYMKGQGSGRIVNITSIGGKVAVPHLAPYVASKFALVGFSEAMRAELIKDGIYVTTVVPGLMRTGSHINAFFKGQHQKEFALFSIANASPLFSTSFGTSRAANRRSVPVRQSRSDHYASSAPSSSGQFFISEHYRGSSRIDLTRPAKHPARRRQRFETGLAKPLFYGTISTYPHGRSGYPPQPRRAALCGSQ